MKLPKGSTPVLLFKHKEQWYQIVSRNDKYELYIVIGEGNYEFIASGNNPQKLENKIYSKG